jgi:hypothetical protein
MEVCPLSGLDKPVSPRLQPGICLFHPPIPVQHCIRLTENLPSAKGGFTGLPRSVQITGWVRCCLYTGRSTSMCSHLTCSHPVFLPFWPVCIINFHTLAHDGTSTAVHVYFTIPLKPAPFRMLLSVREPFSGSFTPQRYH